MANFLFYNRIIFGTAKADEDNGEKVDVDSVRKTGKEKQSNSKSQNNTNKKRK